MRHRLFDITCAQVELSQLTKDPPFGGSKIHCPRVFIRSLKHPPRLFVGIGEAQSPPSRHSGFEETLVFACAMRRSAAGFFGVSSPSHVPCQSSPSAQVTPVTKRSDSMVRRIARSRDRPGGSSGRDTAHPERPLGPRHPESAAVARRRDRREHAAGLRIDLLDAVLGDLEEVLAVERRARMRRGIDRARHLPAFGISAFSLSPRRTTRARRQR